MNNTISVIILTKPGDIHAHAVNLGIRRLAHSSSMLYLCNLPFNINASISSHQRNSTFDVHIGHLKNPSNYVLWNRRRGHITIPLGIHPEDEKIALEQCNRFLDSLCLILNLNAIMTVNDYTTFHVAERAKILQLIVAKRNGLMVPKTLVTNVPDNIRNFVCAGSNRIIHKPLSPSIWEDDDHPSHWATTEFVRDSDLPESYILRAAPGIFQHAIRKAFEVRAHVIGRTVISARLDIPDKNSTNIDWRTDQKEIKIRPYKLPETISKKLIKTLGDLGLIFGCADFIVDDAGEHIFLEVNQMGQFLWVEEKCPQIKLLDTFCRFLLSGKQNFEASPQTEEITLEMVAAEAAELSKKESHC